MHFCRIFATTPEYSRSVLSSGFYIVPFGGILAAAIYILPPHAYRSVLSLGFYIVPFGGILAAAIFQHSAF